MDLLIIETDLGLITTIIGVVGSLIGVVFGTKWKKGRTKFAKTLKEGAEFLSAVSAAAENDKPTEEQIRLIIKEAKDLVALYKKEVPKKVIDIPHPGGSVTS
jgi:hypothetical protein